jgi:hypothetical protein
MWIVAKFGAGCEKILLTPFPLTLTVFTLNSQFSHAASFIPQYRLTLHKVFKICTKCSNYSRIKVILPVCSYFFNENLYGVRLSVVDVEYIINQ